LFAHISRQCSADRLCVPSAATERCAVSRVQLQLFPDCIELWFTLEEQMKVADDANACVLFQSGSALILNIARVSRGLTACVFIYL
jgi:hypothetical protein